MSLFDHLCQSVSAAQSLTGNHCRPGKGPWVDAGEMKWRFADSQLVAESYQAGPKKIIMAVTDYFVHSW